MFDSLSDRLAGVFDKLRGRGALTELDVRAAMREVRIALLEADVALPVVKDFINAVREKAIGQDVIRSVSPGQMVVKIVHDHLVEVLGSGATDLSLQAVPPVVYLMVGLQGSGKTTTTAKIALRFKNREKRKVMMASLDVNRPAAQEQLQILGKQIEVETLPIVKGEAPLAITQRALTAAALGGFDVLLLDTAGRLHIDEGLMFEVAAVRDLAKPHETLLVADAMTGQDAINVAKSFNDRIGVTGIVLTRVDGDSRGGAALSMRAVTGKPIKFAGTGEKLDAIEAFNPGRVAGRILGMGDIVSIVEKAAQAIDENEAERMAARMAKGQFDMNDLAGQFRNMRKMGGIGALAGMIPGMKKAKAAMASSGMDDKVLVHLEALIGSMTPKERTRPELLNAKRKIRVAKGAGLQVQDVNKLLKMHQEMATAMKRLKKMGGLKGLAGMFGGGAGGMGGMSGGGLPGLGGGMGANMGGGALPSNINDLLKK